MIDKKWKWVARTKDGEWWIHTDRPKFNEYAGIWHPPMCRSEYNKKLPNILSVECDWKDSLHEIIHHEDGKIEFRKARPELKVDDPVLVKCVGMKDWSRRHFSRWRNDGKVVAWINGRTSFSANNESENESAWDEYKLP